MRFPCTFNIEPLEVKGGAVLDSSVLANLCRDIADRKRWAEKEPAFFAGEEAEMGGGGVGGGWNFQGSKQS